MRSETNLIPRCNRPLEAPTFRQSVRIAYDTLRHLLLQPEMHWNTERSILHQPGLLEEIKLHHLRLGFSYENDQIHRALSAVEFRWTSPRMAPSNNRFHRWASGPPRHRRCAT